MNLIKILWKNNIEIRLKGKTKKNDWIIQIFHNILFRIVEPLFLW